MSFECPACSGSSLTITFSLELPPGDQDDEVTIQTLKCGGCDFRGMGVYRESRRGSLASESWHHDGYQVGDDDLEFLLNALLLCPSPGKRGCQCQTHLIWGKCNWANPSQNGIKVEKHFKMRLVS